jgi:GAF domain-containing protein
MAESFFIPKTENKTEIYKALLPQIFLLWESETDCIANLSNTTAVLKEALEHFWIGFYLLKDKHLVLGPFQGTLACTRIPLGKGVCGKSALEKKTIVVPNVHEFSGHIACSSLSNSEIVVPLINENQKLLGVLDMDSTNFNAFDNIDAFYLEELCKFIANRLNISI